MTIKAFCKLNLSLYIGKKRTDGYHSLDSIMVLLDLADLLRLETGQEAFSVSGPFGEGVPLDGQNLVLKTLKLFRESTGFAEPLGLRLEKNVPHGAGLGGASADAAALLLALNRLWGGKTAAALSEDALLDLGARLGSDIPFFVRCFLHKSACAKVGGRGEKVEICTLTEASALPPEFAFGFSPGFSPGTGPIVLLAMPSFQMPTAGAYAALDEARKNGRARNLEALRGRLPGLLPNSFLEASDAYDPLLEALQEAGARCCGLSGSGSCCFGLFENREQAVLASSLKKFQKFLLLPLAHFQNSVLQ
jgi:4-diphosphocytidyl-2-C-methyl-D-erythritol kinase